MCRFTAYIGNKKRFLSDVLSSPENSLLGQSQASRLGRYRVHADGFGLGWYDREVDEEPAVFRSIQPLWNDLNFQSLSKKIKSNCFIGHVRSANIGDVNISNCQPFTNQTLLMVHNGDIHGFYSFKKNFVAHMTKDTFNLIRGNTDSEYLFQMICGILATKNQTHTLENIFAAILDTFGLIHSLEAEHPEYYSRINMVITNGTDMLATRWSSKKNDTDLNLYINECDDHTIVSSEHLDGETNRWIEIPPQHCAFIKSGIFQKVEPISI